MSETGGSTAAKGCIVVGFLGALAVITAAAAYDFSLPKPLTALSSS